ncbi:MAG: aspartate carbamoyltransferase catalytic subunit [Flavobacteriales bacterium]|nr:aspartate carbamoyltransferase catalytic subunit [Flavobacteriales bacterium]
MKDISVKHLLGTEHLSKKDIELIFEWASHFKEIINRPIKKVPTLRDITIANIFFENSTRTKLSFELAEKRLSADVVNFSAGASSVKKGETLIDTVNNILAMKVDIIVMRHPEPGAALFLSKNVDSRVINAGDGTHEHPTQALLDSFSLLERFESLKGKRIAIVGDIKHSRVALSNIHCLKTLGAEVQVCGPSTLIPKYIDTLGVSVSHDLEETMRWADGLNMLRIQLERQEQSNLPSLRDYTLKYQLNRDLMDKVGKDLVVMHPGPINRGVEITSELADSDSSIILDQVENGVAIRMAVIFLLAQQLNRN